MAKAKKKPETVRRVLECSICGLGWPDQYGNNAWPVNDGRCCDHCNWYAVIPARLKQMAH